MIHHLQGHVSTVYPDSVVLDLHGFGVSVLCPQRYSQTWTENDEVLLYTHLHWSDSGPTLIGSPSKSDIAWIRSLLKIAGVGVKSALACVQRFTLEEFKDIIQKQDVGALSAIPGVGKKTANKIILDMKGHWDHESVVTPIYVNEDAKKALIALGFSAQKVRNAMSRLENPRELTVEETIKKCLSIIKEV